MIIGLQTARELSANELDQVSGGGAFYLGNGDGFVRLPPPRPPIIGPIPVNPGPGSGSGSGSGSGGGTVGRMPPIHFGGGHYLI